MRRYILSIFIIVAPFLGFAQEADSVIQNSDSIINNSIKTDSTQFLTDSTSSILSDSTSTAATDTVKAKKKGDIETTVNYNAKDSLNFNLKTQDIIMYKNAHVDYGDIQLEADKIKVNYNTKVLDASGLADSTGEMTGEPVFTDKGQVYQTEKITYNFDSKKAIIKGVVTQQGEAFMHSNWTKKNEKDEMFSDHALYTTCNLEHPHFGIAANKIKLIPGDKILAGPFNLEITELPTPFLFPFGMFPMPNNKTSGILFPTYGEENRRGFFLRDGGYYWAINEYADMALRGEIYSKGSYGLSVASNYKKRYSYNGNLNIRFSQQNGGETEADSSVQKDFWIQWSHRPESKGTGRFSASVNAGSSDFNNNNPSQDAQQQLSATFNSNVSYSNVIQGTPFNYAISARHDQNVRTNNINLTLPEAALNMNRQYPFKNVNANGLDWLQKMNYSYNFTSTNRITNSLGTVGETQDSIAPFNQETLPYLLKRAQNGGQHRIPISTSFNLLKFITASPSFNYDEVWYLKELNHSYSDSLNTVVVDTLNQFSRASSYSAGIGFTTRLYGTIYPKRGAVKAIRHIMTPSINLNWRPDFGDEKYGIYEEVQSDPLGNTKIYSKYEGFVYGSPGRGKSGTIGISLANTVEMKVKKKSDTSDLPTKVKIFDNLSFSTSYNVIADSFRLAPISINARTNLFNGKLDINIQTGIDPYVMVLDSININENGTEKVYQRRIDQYAWEAGRGIGRLTTANIALSTNLNPAGKKSDDENRNNLESQARQAGATEDQVQALTSNPDMYVDFEVPWNLRVRYNIRWGRQGYEEAKIQQTMNFSGDVNFTENWKVGFTSGYDFEEQDFTQTSINIFRNLHCWQINANWVPFGRFQSFSVDIGVKASILQDLKMNRRRSWWDN
ncbi:putative LPS assembly protein LptD [Marivirga salinae]|uniref:LPS assembly protein LptD n=1 Tax=Marivirga salinarum TaxID=3059078 RepID=A0AA51R853_9BACT|nr:putative LPS assembly protein LptD [Marivirga sp. BDSF4-3]WMN10817.1 putative LPS assembly protein LptD [Marivirga sp. BDSF4-3]